ncbi:MAG: hypothetical protein ABEJ27_02715 [Halodesulfurarchaeum sp.]
MPSTTLATTTGAAMAKATPTGKAVVMTAATNTVRKRFDISGNR